jgi:hypothetical protein
LGGFTVSSIDDIFSLFDNAGLNLRGATGDPELDARFKAIKAQSNKRLVRMKSGSYKIVDYYDNVLKDCGTSLAEAKQAFIDFH